MQKFNYKVLILILTGTAALALAFSALALAEARNSSAVENFSDIWKYKHCKEVK